MDESDQQRLLDLVESINSSADSAASAARSNYVNLHNVEEALDSIHGEAMRTNELLEQILSRLSEKS